MIRRQLLREVGIAEAERVLAAVLGDWEGFTRYAVEHFGGYKPPKSPTVRYLIARDNLAAALNWAVVLERPEQRTRLRVSDL